MAEEDFFVLCMREGRREEVGHAWFPEDWDVRRWFEKVDVRRVDDIGWEGIERA